MFQTHFLQRFDGTNQATSRQIEKSDWRGLLPTLTVEESCCGACRQKLCRKCVQESIVILSYPGTHQWCIPDGSQPISRAQTAGQPLVNTLELRARMTKSKAPISCKRLAMESFTAFVTPVVPATFSRSIYNIHGRKSQSQTTLPMVQLVHCKQDRNAVHLALQTGAMPGRKVRITKRPLQGVWQA